MAEEDFSARAKARRDELQCKMIDTAYLAWSRLEEILRTGESFASDEEARMCRALVMRMAPELFEDKDKPPKEPMFPPEHWTPERIKAMATMDYFFNATPEEKAA